MAIEFLLIVFLAVLIAFIIVVFILLAKKEDGDILPNSEEERQEEEASVDIRNSEVITRYTFWDNEVDKFLRRSYPELCQWKSMGNPIGINFEGPHLCELLFQNGAKEIVTVVIKADILIDIPDKTLEDKAPKDKSPEIAAKEWIAEHKNFLLDKYYKGEGFLIESKDLPDDELTVDLIITYITANGNFSTHYGSEGIRCVAEY